LDYSLPVGKNPKLGIFLKPRDQLTSQRQLAKRIVVAILI
jgi:hypothetical protein